LLESVGSQLQAVAFDFSLSGMCANTIPKAWDDWFII
jgi:hypothetical protein